MRGRRGGALLALLATAVTSLAIMAGSATAAGNEIVIGWAYDGKGAMAPFDGPALAAAQIRVKQWNARGGVVAGSCGSSRATRRATSRRSRRRAQRSCSGRTST